MVDVLSRQNLEAIVFGAFKQEVNALKPGNVSRYASGHGMTVEDFLLSAERVTPILCDQQLSVGERILSGVEETFSAVGCNTNLGMLLLFTPVLKAVEMMNVFNIKQLQKEIKKLIKNIEHDDTVRIFQAIRLANPGGLGQSEKYDVNLSPDGSLWQAMDLASKWDFIAKQYVNGFVEVIYSGAYEINSYNRRWKSVEWSAVACYLNLLSGHADSHVARRSGMEIANQTSKKAKYIARQLDNYDNPAEAFDLLLDFDRELKDSKINPGTTADITAAALLVYGIGEFCNCRWAD